MSNTCDFLIIGAGIAGASVAYWLSPHGRTIVLERELQPGYHSTGRSAAQYHASYGSLQVQALTRASYPFLANPPAGFTEAPLLQPRGVLIFGAHAQEALLQKAWDALCGVTQQGQYLDAKAVCALVPVLKPECLIGGVYAPDSYDIDVHALHQGYLKGMRRNGGKLVTSAEVQALQAKNEGWRVHAGGKDYATRVVVNAAGAWCDAIAQLAGVRPVGLVPKRRSAFIFKPPQGVDIQNWPLSIAADECCYFKPDAGMLLGSPANADPTHAQDVQPEELDIAYGVHHLETFTNMQVRPTRTWAGLRSFVADAGLVGGYDTQTPGFFWCAGQGGYGIQTSAAMGQACAHLVLGQDLPADLRAAGLDAAMLSPARLDNPAAGNLAD